MADIQLLDVSLRDGNQSLWGAMSCNTAQTLTIAPVMNRVGFRALDYCSSTAMGVAVRVHRENPWERIRLTRAAMPDTPLQFIGTGLRFVSWEPAHPEFMELVYERLVENGISRFVALEPMHDVEALLATSAAMRRAGASEIIAALTYTVSTVHDDAFYAGLVARLAPSADIDRFYIKDPAGLLTPERARTLIPAIRAQMMGKPLELHSHCTIGLSPLTCMTAAEFGIDVIQVACGAASNGTSLPDAQRMVANLRALGHRVDIDDHALARVAGYFDQLAAAEALPPGTPQQFDAAFLNHQLAGGAISTLKRQLAELKLSDRFDEVMEEVIRVRAELGYPIMVTPFPQIVYTQALYNLISAERYANVPDQVIRYVLGSFGRPTAPVEADVQDRILDRPRARELRAEPPPMRPSELRKRFAPGISDDEFLLRAVMPTDQVDAMLAAGPARRHYNPSMRPLLSLLQGVAVRAPAAELLVDKPDLRFALRGRPRMESADVR